MIEQMLLQEEAQRLPLDNVQGLLRVSLQQIEATLADLIDDLRPNETPIDSSSDEIDLVLRRAARDVLSAKQIFEHVADKEFARFNRNSHCEIAYLASDELFNTCAQAIIYTFCRKKFDDEGGGRWDEADDARVLSDDKPGLQRELEAILDGFPLPRSSPLNDLSRKSAHLFHFCKDYHCKELLKTIRESLYGNGNDSLRANLVDAPILWITGWIRSKLNTKFLKFDKAIRETINLERHLSVLRTETLPLDSTREAIGADLFTEPFNAKDVANALQALETGWGASVGQIGDGGYSVIFRSRSTYQHFRNEALDLVESGSVFEADVLNLLRPEIELDDRVALRWDRDFDVAVTLGKVVGTR